MFCKNCGSEMKPGEKFCPNCGTVNDIERDNAVNLETSKVNDSAHGFTPGYNLGESPIPTVKKKKSKKIIAIIAVLVAVVLVVSFIIVPVISSISASDKAPFLIGIQDGELVLTYTKDSETIQISKDFNLYSLDDAGLYGGFYYDKGNSRLFYPDRMDSDGTYTLYYVTAKQSKIAKSEAVKVDNNIDNYVVTDDGKIIYYIKSDGDLYSMDLDGNKKQIKSDVSYMYYGAENGIFVFVTYNSDGSQGLFMLDNDGSSKQIDSNIDSISYVSDDYSCIAYEKNNTIKMLVNGSEVKEITKIPTGNSSADTQNDETANDSVASNDEIYSVNIIYADSTGKVLYIANKEKEYKIMDFIEDDLLENDKNAVEPDPNDEKYIDNSGFFITYTDEYYDLLEEYYDVEYRNEFREYLSDNTYTRDVRELYYFDGKENKTITNNLTSYSRDYDIESNVLLYEEENVATGSKLKFSEVYDRYDNENVSVNSQIAEMFKAETVTWKGVVNGEITDLGITDKNVDQLKIEGSTLYYTLVDTENNDGNGTLYTSKLSGNKISKGEKLYDNVCSLAITKDGSVLTYRDEDDSTADLYINDKKIESAVTEGAYVELENGFIAYYFSEDLDFENTVKIYDGKESKALGDDVVLIYYVDDDKIYFISDVSATTAKGDLKLYDGKESTVVGYDFTYIFTPVIVND